MQLGSGREQTYLFPCPGCGVELGFTLFIDQSALKLDYGDLNNLDFSGAHNQVDHLRNFSSDFLVSKTTPTDPMLYPGTPQFENLRLVRNMAEYFSLRERRRRAINDFWPSLERAYTHFKNGDYAKFDNELRSVGADRLLQSYSTKKMALVIAEAYELFESFFTSSLESEKKLIDRRISSAVSADKQSVSDLEKFYANDQKGDHLSEELRALDKQWANLYSFFEPLEIVECLKDPNIKLCDQFTLSEKPIEKLKTFYCDCFETLGRLLVIAACIEGIAAGCGMGVPSKKRLMPPDEYAHVSNGSKPDLISNMPFWPLFGHVFDSKLRNGIGHHSWRYDTASDTIHYQNNSPARGREEFEISYLDFCIHTRRLYHAATLAAKYLRTLRKPSLATERQGTHP